MSFNACEVEIRQDIDECCREVAKIRPGLAARFFDDCLYLWRRDEEQKSLQKEQEEMKKREAEEQKEARVSGKREEELRARKEAKAREKIELQLLAQEERELELLTKKKSCGSKKKKAAKRGIK